MNTEERVMSMFKIFSGNTNRGLADSIVQALGVPLGQVEVKRFSDGETHVEFLENVRRIPVVLVQSTCPPHPNAALAELELLADAARRAGASEVCAVVPYYGYARQDRRGGKRTSVSVRVTARRLEVAGVGRLMVVEPHSDQMEMAFDIPTDLLLPRRVMNDGILQCEPIAQAQRDRRLIIVSPDPGGTKRARAYARALGTGFAIADKDRIAPNQSRAGMVIGDVDGMCALMVDDMIDTAGTLTDAGAALKKAGATEVYAAAVHPVLSGPAIERLDESVIKAVFVSNTIPCPLERRGYKVREPIQLGEFIAEAIKRMLTGNSVSELSTVP